LGPRAEHGTVVDESAVARTDVVPGLREQHAGLRHIESAGDPPNVASRVRRTGNEVRALLGFISLAIAPTQNDGRYGIRVGGLVNRVRVPVRVRVRS
jgi:hypothetical protein